jgi:hypothetical protein
LLRFWPNCLENDEQRYGYACNQGRFCAASREFILEREVVAIRWVMIVQISYFFGTLAAVWFMVNHLPK